MRRRSAPGRHGAAAGALASGSAVDRSPPHAEHGRRTPVPNVSARSDADGDRDRQGGTAINSLRSSGRRGRGSQRSPSPRVARRRAGQGCSRRHKRAAGVVMSAKCRRTWTSPGSPVLRRTTPQADAWRDRWCRVQRAWIRNPMMPATTSVHTRRATVRLSEGKMLSAPPTYRCPSISHSGPTARRIAEDKTPGSRPGRPVQSSAERVNPSGIDRPPIDLNSPA